ncbi:hypothetical protein GCM10020366_52450 [Saccharopolyspora gregorii]|uniref:Uncharacterized protein n=1 Tax=Saccharopolyspora gregorii TaxID=33914 RepID=A0ABP6RXT1_9PSEU
MPTRAAASTAGTMKAPNSEAISEITVASVIAVIAMNMILFFWMSAAASLALLARSRATADCSRRYPGRSPFTYRTVSSEVSPSRASSMSPPADSILAAISSVRSA